MFRLSLSSAARFFIRCSLLLITGVVCVTPAPAQKQECEEAVGSFTGYVIRSLKVEAPRWGSAPPLPVPKDSDPPPRVLAVGEAFSAEDALFKTQETILAKLKQQGVEGLELGESRGTFGISKIRPCVKRVEASACRASLAAEAATLSARGLDSSKCVDLTFKTFYVRVDLYKIGSNLLPVPRSNRPTAYDRVPTSLLALNPSFGLSYDRRAGLSQRLGISMNLLDPLEKLDNDDDAGEKTRLALSLKGNKSVNKPFYHAAGKLILEHRQPGKVLESIGLEGSFDAQQQPLGEGKQFKNIARIGLDLTLRPRLGLLDSITLNARYRFSGNRFFTGDGARAELTAENSFEARFILDGRLAGGLTRLGLWADSNSPERHTDSYRRLVGVFGYTKEIPLKLNQTIGVEAIAGLGRAWGSVPEYARFYGGSSLGNFLYDEVDSDALFDFPTGPLLRSFGSNQALPRPGAIAARGATSFWHVNLSASIPLPSLSRPLIPAEKLGSEDDDDDEAAPASSAARDVCGHRRNTAEPTLKDLVKSSVKSANSFLIAHFKAEGMNPEEARKAAKENLKEICPAVYFLADQANLYSLKPLILFDAARLANNDLLNNRTRVAVGGGLQFTFIIARFELGYMRSVRRLESDPRGNLVVRLVFQNLF